MNTFKLHITGIDLLNDFGNPLSCPIAQALKRKFKAEYSVGGFSARLKNSNEYHLRWNGKDSSKIADRAGKWWNIFTRGITIEITNQYS